MTDPLSVVAGATGFITFALHGIRVLWQDLDNIKQAPENILSLKDELRSVERVISSLESIGDDDWKHVNANVVTEVKWNVESCTRTCEMFRLKIQHWTRHSTGEKLSLIDRPHIGFFRSSEIKSMHGKLQAYKTSISCVTSVGTLHGVMQQTRGQETAAAISTRQEQAIVAQRQMETQESDLNSRLRELNVSDDSTAAAEIAAAEIEAARAQMEEERETLKASKKMIDEVLLSLKETAALAKTEDNSVHVNFGGSNYGIMMGVNHGNMSNITFGAK